MLEILEYEKDGEIVTEIQEGGCGAGKKLGFRLGYAFICNTAYAEKSYESI